jgi:membrane-associated PAP2 superfamily phosphatase
VPPAKPGGSRRWRIADPALASLAFVLLFTAVFLAFPAIDLRVSGLFYDPAEGFYLARSPALLTFRNSNDAIVAIVVFGLIASLVVKLARPERPSIVAPNSSLFLLASLALGPGVLVNLILKNLWGRPRPVLVDAFGGTEPYVAVWHISDSCATNCSFVAGEASSAIWLVAIAWLLPAPWQKPAAVVAGLYAAAIAVNRIAFGGHFLSDVLISFGLTLLVVALCHRFIVERPPPALTNPALEAGLSRLGLAIHRAFGSR